MKKRSIKIDSKEEIKFSIRKATREDLHEILRCHQDSIREIALRNHNHEQISSWSVPLTQEGYAKAMDDGEEYYVSEDNGQVVAFSSLKNNTVMAVYVSKASSEQGVGKSLYFALE